MAANCQKTIVLQPELKKNSKEVMSWFSGATNQDLESVDKLSNLPDEIVSHIISFLPTNLAVATSILSRRWRWLFKFIRRVDFDIYHFGQKFAEKDFVGTVSKFLTELHEVSEITRFRVRYNLTIDPTIISEWLSIASSKGVEELELEVHAAHSITDLLPYFIFSSKSLKTLKLDCSSTSLVDNDIPMEVSFPGLKALHLQGITFSDVSSISRLFSGCPALEDLTFWRCKWQVEGDLDIFTPSLVSLSICTTTSTVGEIRIHAPNLVDVSFFESIKTTYTLKNAKSLKKATLQFKKSKFNALRNIVRGLSNVTLLSVSGDPLRYLHSVYYSHWPTFCNLTKLELHYKTCVQWEILPVLLANCPRVETLSFCKGLNGKDCYGVRHPHRELLPFSSCLTNIEVHQFKGCKVEFEVVEHLLKNSTLLKKMVFYSKKEMSVKKRLRVNEILSKMSKGLCELYLM